MTTTHPLPADISSSVRRALSEDIGTGDLTAELIPPDSASSAIVLSRERAILCGCAWFDEVFHQLDPAITIEWFFSDGQPVGREEIICRLWGNSRKLLTGERTALNYLQLLSGTATVTREYARLLEGSRTRLLDTRKTIPGLRTAQKYAVLCGGGYNHRMGLYDAILIKENHIQAAGSITAAVQQARRLHRSVEVEVETLKQLQEAIDAGANTILLDNFNIGEMHKAVKLNNGRAHLEASGGVDRERLAAIAGTGVDFISVGALTKHVRATDYSMRIVAED